MDQPKVGESKNKGNAGKGRAKGVPNKVTTAFRETVTRLLEDNSENVAIWLQQVASESPKDALDVIAKLAEYSAPKLARQEINHSGETGLTISVIDFTRG